ncbi:MAG: HSP20 family protein [Paraglaciecola sp.]|jgi:HSP20 family protein
MKPTKFQNSKSVGTSIDSFLDSFFNGNVNHFADVNFSTTSPSINIVESENEYKIELAAPGLGKSDFSLNLDQDLLTIEAKIEDKKEETKEKYVKREFNFTSFKRTFTLPDTVNANNINAIYEKGVLSVVLPKKEEAKPLPAKTIAVN